MPTLKRGQSSARSGNSASPVLYTLERDGDRALSFYGTSVAEIDSGDREVTRRAAIYRTRAGRYVAEFSSRPNPARGVFRDPPERMPTISELEEYKNFLVQSVIATAEWREGKAMRFPADHRNSQSVEALRDLASLLDEVQATDQRWRVLWLAENSLDEEVLRDELPIIAEEQNRAKSALIRNYGFGSTQGVPSLEARSFLDSMIDALQEAERRNPPTKSNRKAQAFDTLDEAIAWFRPGYLTTELLKLLGRVDPEFIE